MFTTPVLLHKSRSHELAQIEFSILYIARLKLLRVPVHCGWGNQLMYFKKIFFHRGSFDSVSFFDPQSLRGEIPAREIPSGVPGAQREVSETGLRWDRLEGFPDFRHWQSAQQTDFLPQDLFKKKKKERYIKIKWFNLNESSMLCW